ncbi:hypothetical protein H6761_03075 [Candidatus Nomurabacteria bacterium]|nr:hypothetical protein [Candidatus Nomurabacteria bacterium]
MKFKHLPLPLVAFGQAFFTSVYVLLVGTFMQTVEKWNIGPNVLGIVVILSLLVLSASVCGSLIFGYPIYLLFNKEVKSALILLGYTFLFLLLLIVLTFLMIAI